MGKPQNGGILIGKVFGHLTVAKNALLNTLRKIASYVQGIANHSLDGLLTSGFYANSTNRPQSPSSRRRPATMSRENSFA